MSHEPPNPLEDHEVGLLDAEDEQHDKIVLKRGEKGPEKLEPGTFRKLWLTVITFGLAIGATYAVPQLHFAQPWSADDDYVPFWNLVGREFMGQGAAVAADREELAELEQLAAAEVEDEEQQEAFEDRPVVDPPPMEEGAKFPEYRPHEDDDLDVDMPLEHPEALDHFYEALTLTELGYPGAVTRVSHWGDSVLGNDGITSAIRFKLQARFGDAGHGFHSLAQYNASYKHKGIRASYRAKWSKCYIIQGCKSDGHYGYGGVTVWSGGGSETVLSTANKGAAGRKVSRFELWYVADPSNGRIRIRVDGEHDSLIETGLGEGEGGENQLEDRWAVVEMPDGEHEVSIRASGGGRARAYGAVFEREGPGVVWDGMALIGAFAKRFLNFDPDHIQAQIRHRDPDLLVFMFGGNDLLGFKRSVRKEELTQVVQLARGADPETSCLIMSIVDHGVREGGRVITAPHVQEMVEVEREVAAEQGCAFFDTWTAMGGEGSMGRWNRSNPRLGSGDLAHLTHHGHKVIGEMLYRSLMAGYRDYRDRMAGKELPEIDEDGDIPPKTIVLGLGESPEGTVSPELEPIPLPDVAPDEPDAAAEPAGPTQPAGPAQPSGADEPAPMAPAPGEPAPSPEPPPAEDSSPQPAPDALD